MLAPAAAPGPQDIAARSFWCTMDMRVIHGLNHLAPHYDGFILDLWGVIHDGSAPLPGVLECLERLIENGKRVVLLSNGPRRAADVAERIARIGVPSRLYHHVMSSGEETWQHLKRREDPLYAELGRRCLHIGSERDTGIREGLDLDFVAAPETADFILNTGPAGWEDTVEDYDPLLRRALARDLPMVCANPDLVVRHQGRPALCAGALAERYQAAGGRVRWHGKPCPAIYETTLALLGIADRTRILAVGDSLRTDIAGAAGAGIDSLFIASGIHAEELGIAPRTPLDQDRIATLLAAGGHRPIAVARGLSW